MRDETRREISEAHKKSSATNQNFAPSLVRVSMIIERFSFDGKLGGEGLRKARVFVRVLGSRSLVVDAPEVT